MANRIRRRHRADSLADVVPIVDSQSNQGINSRYDMSVPQNWTVEQLRAELVRNHVSFRKTAKKSRLIQLCKDNGLINTSTVVSTESTGSGQSREDSDIAKLCNTVAELQQTVSTLSQTMDRMAQNVLQHNTGFIPRMDSASNEIRAPHFSASNQGPATTGNNQQTHSDIIADNQTATSLLGSTERNGAPSFPTGTTGTHTRFGYSAETLPFIETVHPTLRKQIIEGKDINLAALLIPYYTGRHADSSEIIKNKDKVDPRLQNSLNLPQFIQAFGIYKNIMCEVFPSRREELDLYERDIVDMASRYGGKAFYEYHKMFSAEAAAHLHYANRKVDWSVRNNKLFTTVFVNQKAFSCNMCYSSLHNSAFCPTHLEEKRPNHSPLNRGRDVKGRSRVTFQGKEICNNFNGQKGCHYARCQNLHICITCKKEHPQHTCSVSKNSQPGKGNTQK